MNEPDFKALREKMVSEQILKRGIDTPKILEAFNTIPRHLFVPPDQKKFAYSDCPLSIGKGQTISQPYMVALMTQVLEVSPGMHVLEVGTGSGYQAAILFFLGAIVYSIERIPALAKRAKSLFDSLGYKIEIKVGDGTLGWPEYAPYDRIIVAAASLYTPPPLIEQLNIGGRVVIPLGQRFHQNLVVLHKLSKDRVKEENICGCVFVPLIGEHGYKE